MLMGGQRRIEKAFHEVTHTGGKQITMAVKMTNTCEPLAFSRGKFKRLQCYLVSKYPDVSVVQVLSNVRCICIVTEDSFFPFLPMAQASFH